MNTATPRIAIIIPIYNVEKYLRRCLDSVINQTYRNLEIILVDDGSPDKSGEICDEYAARDSRIYVIHKKNGGVSSARNAGLKYATSDFIGWVDPDDWIEPEMFAYLLHGLMTAEADIAVCSWVNEYRTYKKFHTWEKKQVLDNEQAVELLIKNDNMQNHLWNKLFCRYLFDDIWFPEGRTYEDIAVMYRLFSRVKAVICLPAVKYHYFQRADGIIADVTLANRINHYISSKERYDELLSVYPQFRELMAAQCVASAIGIWSVYYKAPQQEKDQFSPLIKEISLFSRKYITTARKKLNLGFVGRRVICLIPYPAEWAYALAGFWGFLYKLKNGRYL